MRKKFILMVFIFSSCGLFKDNYEEELGKPSPQKQVFTFPGIVNLHWLQDRTSNGIESTIKNIMVAEKEDRYLDSLHALIWIYNSKDRVLKNLIFANNLNFSAQINDVPQSSDSILFEDKQTFNVSHGEVYLLTAPPHLSSRFSGFYTGEYRTYKSAKLISGGNILGVIDYHGKFKILLDIIDDLQSFDGTILSDSLCFYSSRRSDQSQIDSGNFKISVNSESIFFKTLIGNSIMLDSITIQLRPKL